MKLYLFLFAFCIGTLGYSQDESSNYRSKKLAVVDTLVLDTVSISPSRFEILDRTGKSLDSIDYRVDFKKGIVIFSKKIQHRLWVGYTLRISFYCKCCISFSISSLINFAFLINCLNLLIAVL